VIVLPVEVPVLVEKLLLNELILQLSRYPSSLLELNEFSLGFVLFPLQPRLELDEH
jgi:hypothetical protein